MTTIACDGKKIVTDSASVTDDGIISGPHRKIINLIDGGVLAFCGVNEDGAQAVRWLNSLGMEDKPELEEYFAAIHFDPAGNVRLLFDKLVPVETSFPVFFGSGYQLAMAAYDVSGDLEVAVKTACKFDVSSGGKLQSWEFKDDIT